MKLNCTIRPWHEVDPATGLRSRVMPVEGILIANTMTDAQGIRHDVVVGLNASDQDKDDLDTLMSFARQTVKVGKLTASVPGESFALEINDNHLEPNGEPEPNERLRGNPVTQQYYATIDGVREVLEAVDSKLKKAQKKAKKAKA